jgi:hypothetical protein
MPRQIYEFFNGIHVEVEAYTCDEDHEAFVVKVDAANADERLEIEGDAAVLRDFFKRAIDMIDAKGAALVESGHIDAGWELERAEYVCQHCAEQDRSGSN